MGQPADRGRAERARPDVLWTPERRRWSQCSERRRIRQCSHRISPHASKHTIFSGAERGCSGTTIMKEMLITCTDSVCSCRYIHILLATSWQTFIKRHPDIRTVMSTIVDRSSIGTHRASFRHSSSTHNRHYLVGTGTSITCSRVSTIDAGTI